MACFNHTELSSGKWHVRYLSQETYIILPVRRKAVWEMWAAEWRKFPVTCTVDDRVGLWVHNLSATTVRCDVADYRVTQLLRHILPIHTTHTLLLQCIQPNLCLRSSKWSLRSPPGRSSINIILCTGSGQKSSQCPCVQNMKTDECGTSLSCATVYGEER